MRNAVAKLNEAAMRHEECHGVRVSIDTMYGGDEEHLLGKIHGALDLIARYQPNRLRLMRRDLTRILVQRYAPCRARYLPASRTCHLDTTFVQTLTDAEIAASIVHESVHARLHSRGRLLTRAAAERLCRRAEVRFGRSIPNGQMVIGRAQAALEASDDEVAPPLDPAAMHRLQMRTQIEALWWPGFVKRRLLRRIGARD